MYGYLRYVGMSDRVLVLDNPLRVAWAGFFDWDLPWYDKDDLLGISGQLQREILVFRSGGGFHFIALDLTDWAGKVQWVKAFQDVLALYDLKADYLLQRDNVLRLNAKNGFKPTFDRFVSHMSVKRKPWSWWHAKMIHKNMGIATPWFQACGKLNDWVDTQGRLKIYTSDPNGVFDIAAREMSTPPGDLYPDTGESGETYNVENFSDRKLVIDDTLPVEARTRWAR